MALFKTGGGSRKRALYASWTGPTNVYTTQTYTSYSSRYVSVIGDTDLATITQMQAIWSSNAMSTTQKLTVNKPSTITLVTKCSNGKLKSFTVTGGSNIVTTGASTGNASVTFDAGAGDVSIVCNYTYSDVILTSIMVEEE